MKGKGKRIKEIEADANGAWNELQDYKAHCGQTLDAIKGRIAALENRTSVPNLAVADTCTALTLEEHYKRLNDLETTVILLKKSLDAANVLRQQVNTNEARLSSLQSTVDAIVCKKGGLL
jgi:hypothetical protein